jgi:uncharacterized protein YbjT (DUF2867 family)
MTTIIGATGRVGSAVVRRLLETGQPLRAYVRDADKARRIFGEPDGLQIYRGRLDDPDDLAAGLGDYLSVTLGCPVPATSIRTVCFSRSSR